MNIHLKRIKMLEATISTLADEMVKAIENSGLLEAMAELNVALERLLDQ